MSPHSVPSKAQTTQPKHYLKYAEYNGRRKAHVTETDKDISLQALGIWSTHWVRITPDETVRVAQKRVSQSQTQGNYACPKCFCQAEPSVRSMNTT